jgi:hypothetical protein
MALTESQIQKAMDYVARKMIQDKINLIDVGAVIRWMIENPLPTKAEYQAQLAVWEEEDKAAKIVALQAQLDKLQGSQ